MENGGEKERMVLGLRSEEDKGKGDGWDEGDKGGAMLLPMKMMIVWGKSDVGLTVIVW